MEKTRIAHRCGHKKTYRANPGRLPGIQTAYPGMNCKKCQKAQIAANAAVIFG